LSGSVVWVLGVQESATAANDHLHLHIFVTVGDTDTVRGTVLSDFIGAVEFPTTATGQTSNDQSLTTVAVQAGDRVVVEVGYQAQNTSALSRTGTMHYGGATGVDSLGATQTTVTTTYGWIQFSDPNAVLLARSVNETNMCPNPAVGTSVGSNITLWGMQNGTIARVTGQSGFSRTTAVRGTVSATAHTAMLLPGTWAMSGETWSGYVEAAASRSISGTVYLNYVDTAFGFTNDGDPHAVTYSTTPQAISFSNLTAPVNTVAMYITVETDNAVASDTITVTCVRYDQAASISGYQDGGSASWVWDGTAELSTSHAVPIDTSYLMRHLVRGPNYRR
jgi:hypothetical protein